MLARVSSSISSSHYFYLFIAGRSLFAFLIITFSHSSPASANPLTLSLVKTCYLLSLPCLSRPALPPPRPPFCVTVRFSIYIYARIISRPKMTYTNKSTQNKVYPQRRCLQQRMFTYITRLYTVDDDDVSRIYTNSASRLCIDY